MFRRWLTVLTYVVLGLLLAASPFFLVPDSLATPFSLLQYVGGGLLVVLAGAIVLDVDSLTATTRGRTFAALAVVAGLAGLFGQFVLL